MIKQLAKQSLQWLSGNRFVFRLPRTPQVHLTFDDGPDPVYTGQVMELLERFGQKATFFLVGENVEKSPEIVRQLVAKGHRVGLHTHTHSCLDQLDKKQFESEVERNQRAIQAAIGRRPKVLRPPRGQFNLKNLSWASQIGIQVVHYTVTSNDWKAQSAAFIVQTVAARDLVGGEIVSFHDNNPFTVEALPTILAELQQRKLSCQIIPLDQRFLDAEGNQDGCEMSQSN